MGGREGKGECKVFILRKVFFVLFFWFRCRFFFSWVEALRLASLFIIRYKKLFCCSAMMI